MKEEKEILEELLKLLKDGEKKLGSVLKRTMNDAIEENALISLKMKKGVSEVKVQGSTIAILIALSQLEKSILEKLNPPKGLYELIKKSVSYEEADNE